MDKKEMYTRDEVMRWTMGFVQERTASAKDGTSSCEVNIDGLGDIMVQFNIDGMLTKDSAKILQELLEYYHQQWLSFYQENYEGLALMNRVHDNLTYYYEAWYYFCRPGTYRIEE